MVKWLPSIPYPPAQEGYWSPVTSTLDWCEENYYATKYSAEVVNTFTNLMFMYLAYKGISNCLRAGHDRVFLVSFVGYLIVGTGSFLFHSTLKYPMQLVDELSMIYTTCIMFYASFARGRSYTYSLALSVFLISLAVFITGYYHYLQDPLFHQNAYALLTAIVLIRSMYVMELGLRPEWKAKERELRLHQLGEKPALGHTRRKSFHLHDLNGNSDLQNASPEEMRRRDERDIVILRTMWSMIALGLSIFLGGFAIWNLDNMFCSKLRVWRREIGLPWGILLEGHGWWHLMTGIGAYFYIVWGIWLRHCLNNRQDEFELNWPSVFTSFPTIERRNDVRPPTREGIRANGMRKKTL